MKDKVYYPGKEEFIQLDSRANMLIVYRKILIDTEGLVICWRVQREMES